MSCIEQKLLTGERALFQGHDLCIRHSTFADGESPLKESRNIELEECFFKWKYPLWYSKNVRMKNSVLLETARSGIWYTDDIHIEDSTIEAPKTFRRSQGITLQNVIMPHAQETLWNCEGIRLENVTAAGDYFGMNSAGIKAECFHLTGNYAFDGARDIEIHDARMLSKDAFWNCENVTVTDSVIVGEYIGWNSKNLKFVNCTIESLQGFCYVDNLVLQNCKLLNTTLAFEYSTVDVCCTTVIDSVKNPLGGKICAKGIGELILEKDKVDPGLTKIAVGMKKNAV